jgi:hypothetical protein
VDEAIGSCSGSCCCSASCSSCCGCCRFCALRRGLVRICTAQSSSARAPPNEERMEERMNERTFLFASCFTRTRGVIDGTSSIASVLRTVVRGDRRSNGEAEAEAEADADEEEAWEGGSMGSVRCRWTQFVNASRSDAKRGSDPSVANLRVMRRSRSRRSSRRGRNRSRRCGCGMGPVVAHPCRDDVVDRPFDIGFVLTAMARNLLHQEIRSHALAGRGIRVRTRIGRCTLDL